MEALFNLIIYPLKFIIEFSFSLFHQVFKNPLISIFGVSLAVSIMCLPLYIIAERWQEIERQTQEKLKPGIDRIKKFFKGDEQYMILNTYYRQNNYHPLMALRSSFSLLIQIPFFMAAYSYLSHLSLLEEASFFDLFVLSNPDQLISIGSIHLNFLPVLMTIINCASGFVYSKGHALREKLQIYIMAALFLFVLYDSPSGLVIYWTLNQVFSLAKNIFFKLKNPGKVFYFIVAAFIVLTDFYLLFIHHGYFYRRVTLAVVISIQLFIPLIKKFLVFCLHFFFEPILKNNKDRFLLFITSALAFVLLTGLFTPSSVISSSVEEFMNIDSYTSPVPFIYHTLFQTLGLFFLWPTVIFLLFGEKIKTYLAVLFSSFSLGSIINNIAFVGDYGTLENLIVFTDNISGKTSTISIIANLIVLLILVVLVFVLIKIKKQSFLIGLFSIISVAFAGNSIFNISQISSSYEELNSNIEVQETSINPKLHFSKSGKNIVVIMADRCESSYFDSIFEEEDPSLKEIYDGFVLYPNTISYGGHTIIGAPPLFGGYEYTPEEWNKRSNELNVDKHNEAIKVMPAIFSDNGFDVTVTDTSWAGYKWIADMSIYSGHHMENVKAEQLEYKYTSLWMQEHKDSIKENIVSDSIKRNLLWFGLFKSCPFILRDAIYEDGNWWNTDEQSGDLKGFIDFYSVLDYLPKLTDFSEEKKDKFFLITNDTTHSNYKLNPPEYEISKSITNSGVGKYNKESGYSANVAFFKKIGKWINYLKQNKLYDNTRIIIVSDHGIGKAKVLEQFTGFDKNGFNPDHLHPILFVKDFNQHGPIQKNYTFMTNADTPIIAVDGVISAENQVNPFTGKKLDNSIKTTQGAIVTTNGFWSPEQHYTNTFKIDEDITYIVKDNIFDSKNWTQK